MDNISQEKVEEKNTSISKPSQDGDAGSQLIEGKFRDTEALVKAYNLLQADYTKKCQALSELQKKANDKTSTENELDAAYA